MFILGVRFLYGLRIAGPVILGSSKVPVLRFAVLNAIGAAVWAALIAGAGYLFGASIDTMLADLKTVEELVLVGILVVGAAVWIWRRAHTRVQTPQ